MGVGAGRGHLPEQSQGVQGGRGPNRSSCSGHPKASAFLPGDPVNAPLFLGHFELATASVTKFRPLTVTSGSLPSVSPQIKWEDFEAPLESCPALMHGRPDT